MYAAALLAEPALQEPVFLGEIQVPEQTMGGVYGVPTRRRGIVFGEEQRLGTLLFNIKSYLPVIELFGFNGDLRAATSGQAFPQSVFGHWLLLPGGSPLDPTSKVGAMAQEMHKRKGIKVEIPGVERESQNPTPCIPKYVKAMLNNVRSTTTSCKRLISLLIDFSHRLTRRFDRAYLRQC